MGNAENLLSKMNKQYQNPQQGAEEISYLY